MSPDPDKFWVWLQHLNYSKENTLILVESKAGIIPRSSLLIYWYPGTVEGLVKIARQE